MENNVPLTAILGPFMTKSYVRIAPEFILIKALAPRASTRNKKQNL
jgi:hypothetical protein